MITSSGMHFMTFGTNFRDAVIVAFTNCATSVFAAIIIFAIMGFKVNRNKNIMIDFLENEKKLDLQSIGSSNAVTHHCGTF